MRTRNSTLALSAFRPRGLGNEMAAITEKQILDALSKIPDPDRGGDIVSLGMVSGIAIRDGNVAFSIEVEPERGPRLEPLRKAAEKAVEALPGVLSVTAVLTAQAAPRGRVAPQPAAAPPRPPPPRTPREPDAARRGARRRRHRRGRLGQGRGRQIDRRRQSGAGAEGQRAARRRARRRHLRAVDAAHARDFRPALLARRQDG